MDYDFITTCNWTATGTYTLQAYRGSNTNVANYLLLQFITEKKELQLGVQLQVGK
jgi:hypothetical protein